jgi:hypothetical protein
MFTISATTPGNFLVQGAVSDRWGTLGFAFPVRGYARAEAWASRAEACARACGLEPTLDAPTGVLTVTSVERALGM